MKSSKSGGRGPPPEPPPRPQGPPPPEPPPPPPHGPPPPLFSQGILNSLLPVSGTLQGLIWRLKSLRAGLISRLSYCSSRVCLLPPAGLSAGPGSFQGISMISESPVTDPLKALKAPAKAPDP